MNTEKLLKFITEPQSLNQDSLDDMQKLVQLFPYSQNIQLLYLFNLSNTQDIRFGEQLQKTATYTANRRLLKKQIEDLKIPVVSEDIDLQEEPVSEQKFSSPKETEPPLTLPSSSESEELKYDKDLEAKPYKDLISERNKMRSKAELLQLVKKRLAEIGEEKAIKQTSTESDISAEEESPLQNKLDLIDKFIRVEPRISRPEKTAFFDPDVAAQESLFEDGAFVTETLAKIYSDQGNYKKSIEIYQILSLNNSEKSSYFAALIQELENKIN